MYLIRFLLFIFIVVTPILFTLVLILSVRTRNILLDRLWLKRYVLPSFLLFVIMILNIPLFVRFFPNILGQTHITCVSQGNVEHDISEVSSFNFVGLVDVQFLDYKEPANVFDPGIVGYVNTLYYDYDLVSSFHESIDEQGLLKLSQNQPAFLMDASPCASLASDETLEAGVYLVVGDKRSLPLTYLDQWYEHSYTVFSFQAIEGYDPSLSFEEQAVEVQEHLQGYIDLLTIEE